MLIASFVVAAALALVHLFAGKLRFVDVVPRSRWLSFAGGISVAYIFMHLLPELEEGQETLRETLRSSLVEHPAYLLALVGLAVFYGLERMADQSRKDQRDAGGEDRTSPGVFWIHIGSFGVYNALIGYILSHREEGLGWLAVFAVAMVLHFFVNDFGLREHHRDLYRRTGRWLLAVAVLLGWALGAVLELTEAAMVAMVALIGGGVILNVLKEELPRERESRFWAFAAGMAGYAALLLAI